MGWFADSGYWLGRLLFQRGLAALYLIAFLTAAAQFRPLLGEHGLLPVPRLLARTRFRDLPSLFHAHYSDRAFAAVAWTGAVASAALLAGAGDRMPLSAAMALWALVWALYLSIVNVGQTWYAFGWETLLLEAGFLAVFLGNDDTAPPVLVLWLLRWLLFRLEFGAGLIKMRGDRCWRDLTCLYYHHETQPMPGPLSWFFHHLPRPVHRAETAANHVAQLAAPVVLFAPQPASGIAAAFMVVTQLWLVVSGNFAWLNWLTIVLALSVMAGPPAARLVDAGTPHYAATPGWFEALVLALTVLVAVLSYRPARNMLSRRQLMNASFEPLHLVNTYGAFGSVGRTRYEVVVEGTRDPGFAAAGRTPGALGTGTGTGAVRWEEYGFRGKPGDVRRMPRQFAPYHLRLDWLMWFAALSPSYAGAWLPGLLDRLLDNDPAVLRLLRANPFPDAPPTAVRARLYRYRFTDWRELRATGAWWHRTLVGDYVHPVTRTR
ncbi:lipase maturation factor family protein [Actinacidiphila acidipaludis]|uniref:Lipase maturation factor family protein n=1 Tax=Actinacidiphila acidipaludis TaxID=2873382 RepID=A0ABS7QDP1_9ACTN|nr:lipase maturation factor family protein [Streptomyces acidipaludis]MBY8881285.1 lipase maturation factor family protein [Streptomyces acidipaludis]